MGRFLAAFLVFAALSGCASRAKLEKNLSSWVGAPAQRLVDKWGYPASQITAPNGNTVYVYSNRRTISMPVSSYTIPGNAYTGTAPRTEIYGGGTADLWCDVFFEIGGDGAVIRWEYRGNYCVSR